MPLLGHLEELRWRLVKSLLAIAVAFIPSFMFVTTLFAFLLQPLHQLPDPPPVVGLAPAEAFFAKLKVAFIAAIFAALPVIFYQLWQFVAPGLYQHEKRYVFPFVLFGSFFFLLGAGFCYQVVLPVAYGFFLEEYKTIGVQATLRISEYFSFTSRMLLAFGVTFELPVLAFFFARVGIITHRTLLDFSRYAVVGIFIMAAVLTPGPDVASQLLLAGPLLLLYLVSIGVAYMFGKREAMSEALSVRSEE
ncbi:MAG: twin-arginine translocase subunit TatC [Deltaproteobacteria bacterium]|nr:twin-arginine translocase subunit TatC [Deltaproteobacteria bacterium]